MAAVASEGKVEIDVKWAALNLRVRLVGAAHHRWFRTWIRRHDAATVRYSLRIRFRKLWLRIRGKHSTGPVKKPKWRRTISSVGNQLLLLRNNSSSHKKIVSQEAEKGFVDALRSDRAVMQVMHGVGMASTLIVLVQLTGLLPLFVILAIAATIVFVNRQHSDSSFEGLRFQQLWQQGVSISAISLVPQALRAVLRPYLPQSGFTAMGTITLLLVLLARYQRLPFKAGKQFFGVLPAGILVLWAPIVQLWNCWWSPANVNFMQVLTGLVAVVSNCFLGYMRNGNILFSTS